MPVLRSLMVLGSLLLLIHGAGCSSPVPDVVATTTEETTTTSEGNSTATSTSADVDTSTSTDVDSSTSMDVDSSTSGTGDTEPTCGNGVVEVGESCDDAGESPTCNDDCTPVACGDGVINEAAGEECEGDDLTGGTCEGLGFDVGTLACAVGCSYDVSECYLLPGEPVLQLSFSQVKRFDFSWAAVPGAEYYQLLESPAPGEAYASLGGDIVGESVSFEMPLHFRWQASYVLRACNAGGCTDSATVDVTEALVDAVGYVKASNPGSDDYFGRMVAISGDGNTLAVGAYFEDSDATGIGGNQGNDSSPDSGAVYVFVRDGMGTWSQQAYIKASNPSPHDIFGYSLALSGDGNTLAVGAPYEDSDVTGIGANPGIGFASDAGAVYLFTRDGMGTWSQQTYVKASNTGWGDEFSWSLALSGDGNTLAVGARYEDSNATGVGGNQADDSAFNSGAVYVFVRDGKGGWLQQAYLKASNTGMNDGFGFDVTLSEDGDTLAVAALGEASNAVGVGGNQADDSSPVSGAVYVFVRDGMGAWSQQAYVKASNTSTSDYFGFAVALSGDGNTLSVGARGESSSATGIDGNQADDSSPESGAVYVLTRDGMGTWSHQAYVKASNPDSNDWFGISVALSGDGNTLAVTALSEDSNATGIGGNQADDSAISSGAVYLLTRDGMGTWSQQAYVKASNTNVGDHFGFGVALSGDGNTLAIGASHEDSNATGIGGNQGDDSVTNSGAVYLY
ncbi:hypothetical protein [Paraliomyxa miuraensis]|uniref:hypothetical protein n=1 Tax=Paraliomyxa miuraensis TaxID=376150 RepID=UPI002257C539|nr:hypothetical protein [Paraliomyxa miuraensis]MCX4241745.1 FG-GAP repeat protein [Paraliomyxa miuraensis]